MGEDRIHDHVQDIQPDNYTSTLVRGTDRRKFYRIALICFLAAILVGGVVGTAISVSFH